MSVQHFFLSFVFTFMLFCSHFSLDSDAKIFWSSGHDVTLTLRRRRVWSAGQDLVSECNITVFYMVVLWHTIRSQYSLSLHTLNSGRERTRGNGMSRHETCCSIPGVGVRIVGRVLHVYYDSSIYMLTKPCKICTGGMFCWSYCFTWMRPCSR